MWGNMYNGVNHAFWAPAKILIDLSLDGSFSNMDTIVCTDTKDYVYCWLKVKCYNFESIYSNTKSKIKWYSCKTDNQYKSR